MDTDSRSSKRQESGDVSNVVPFPRDWIGPSEQLVPFGACEEDRSEGPGQSGRPLGPDAFWGESAAALHEAMEAPADPLEQSSVSSASHSARRRLARVRIARLGGWRPPRAQLALPGVALCLLVAAAIGVVARSAAVSVTSHPRNRAVAHLRADLAPYKVATADAQAAFWRGDLGLGLVRVDRRSPARRGQAVARRSGRPSQTRAGGRSDVSQAGLVANSPTVPGTAASSDVDRTTGSSATAYEPADDSDASSATATSSGPVGAGAPFGPGETESGSG